MERNGNCGDLGMKFGDPGICGRINSGQDKISAVRIEKKIKQCTDNALITGRPVYFRVIML
jgi:hypothetical protein